MYPINYEINHLIFSFLDRPKTKDNLNSIDKMYFNILTQISLRLEEEINYRKAKNKIK